MDRCKHVGRLRLAQNHSILNPQKWHCVDCNTTESVWACLKCSNVACGRYIEEHALKHFKETRHPLAMEVNELYVFCYLCDDYVLNDNATGDLKLLRSTLSAIKNQKYSSTARNGRALRSLACGASPCTLQKGKKGQTHSMEQMFTALWHRRQSLLTKAMRTWFEQTTSGKRRLEEKRLQEEMERRKEEARKRRQELKRKFMEELANTPPRKSARILFQIQKEEHISRKCKKPTVRKVLLTAPTSKRQRNKMKRYYAARRKPVVTPGVTGLRNLGNTCYMNSILQVLSHLQKFRECFLTLDLCETEELLARTTNGKTRLSNKVTLGIGPAHCLAERKDHVGTSGRYSMPSGLNGGASVARSLELIQPKEPSSKHISLCHELHTLFRVMWSGKWALVSPFAMLHSVWSLIPAFRGYGQQDAQEFLCELLDKVQQELESEGTKHRILIPFSQRKLTKQVLKVVNTIFHGQLLSQVTCLTCNYKSNTIEPFWDLSLEFPERYHCLQKGANQHKECTLTEMLAKFTETEALEGRIYACDQCNRKRRKSSPKPLVLTEAQKQLMIYRLPQVLRLHLKRFRWSGRNHREKIGVHVSFDQVLNMEPYCCEGSSSILGKESFIYDLSAVVMHHGKGFGSGHYTAYCYNTEGGFWVHCNDSKLNVCSVEEVCKTQAYILFYTQRTVQSNVEFVSKMHSEPQVPTRNTEKNRRLTFP
ncbi:ubiquitin carboxyl-terminal hydrolase 49-like isoform X2 [Mobula birostris]|uniref:ubiquitin carboxyl-terminal hydrolase 49-like isoform X2 n=1 Tax=Mobula birostris TaxID=1983395 RepID=UPI003B288FF7